MIEIVLWFLLGVLALFVLFVLLFAGSVLFVSLLGHVPFVPTSSIVAREMLLLADVKSGETVVDLGSGTGDIVRLAARVFDARGIGVEINPVLVWFSRLLAHFEGISSCVSFLRANLSTAALPTGDVFTLYLFPELHTILEPKLRALPTGTRIVCHAFPIQGMTPTKTKSLGNTTLFLYVITHG